MASADLQQLKLRLEGLVVFRGLGAVPAVDALRMVLYLAETDPTAARLVPALAAFEQALLPYGGSWTLALLDALLEDENICIRKAASGGAGPMADACLRQELDFLQALGRLTLDDVLAALPPPPARRLRLSAPVGGE